ncbi:uncharacterized protein MEPE_03209 [Melanopsichium pennsylvanicum]|uniref:Uncharacterized protein n=1 Tax=Melanopsichium pennsylvanicum TaxID=63383 RepID=A0AAJ4XL04_9BASI|nr:uncharacterized protein MEPE_03209 [Melanopsichium pennsylvanicum]
MPTRARLRWKNLELSCCNQSLCIKSHERARNRGGANTVPSGRTNRRSLSAASSSREAEDGSLFLSCSARWNTRIRIWLRLDCATKLRSDPKKLRKSLSRRRESSFQKPESDGSMQLSCQRPDQPELWYATFREDESVCFCRAQSHSRPTAGHGSTVTEERQDPDDDKKN